MSCMDSSVASKPKLTDAQWRALAEIKSHRHVVVWQLTEGEFPGKGLKPWYAMTPGVKPRTLFSLWLVAYPGGEQHEGSSTAQRRTTPAGLPRTVTHADSEGQHDGSVDAEACGASQTLADAGRQRGELRRGHGDLACAPRAGQGEGDQRQRDGHAADDRRTDVADADEDRRREGLRLAAGTGQRQGPADAQWRGPVGDAPGSGRDASPTPGPREHQGREPAWAARGSSGDVGGTWWLVEPDVGRVADGVPARVDRLRSLGNALVPQIAEWIGNRVLAYEGGLT